METALRRMAEMLDATVDAVRTWFAEAEAVPLLEPVEWPIGLWLLLAALVLLLVATLRRRSRSPLEVRSPEILITQGELLPESRTGRLGAGTLTMSVSNLGRYPVQLLEAACRTGAGGRFGIADTVVLVPAMGEVEVAVRLPVGKLDDGVLDLYCYAAATRTKTWRHRAELVWEPWAKRFKVAPLEQRVEPVRALPSGRRDVVRMDEVARAEETAARNAAASARHTDGSGRRTDPATRRSAADARRTAAGDVREAAPVRAADAGAVRPDSLIALLGSSRTRPVEPPRETSAGDPGATARAGRQVPTLRPVASKAGGTPDRAGAGVQLIGSEVVVAPAPVAPASTSASTSASPPPAPADATPEASPREPAATTEGSVVPASEVSRPRTTPATLRSLPTVAQRTAAKPVKQPAKPEVLGGSGDPVDPDAPPTPRRPRDQVLEFPDDF